MCLEERCTKNSIPHCLSTPSSESLVPKSNSLVTLTLTHVLLCQASRDMPLPPPRSFCKLFFLILSSRAQLHSTLCDPMDCSQPGSSVHGIFQIRILEWVAFPFSRGFSQPRDQTQVSHIAGRFFTS